MRWIASVPLLALTLAGSPARADVLWEQPLTGSLGEALSQQMPDEPTGSVWAFDDFTIVGGGWTVNHIVAWFYEVGGVPPPLGVYAAFTDSPAKNEIKGSYPGVEAMHGMSAVLTFDFPNVNLGPGTHWLTVWVKRRWAQGDARWRITGPVQGSEYFFHNPGGGLGFGTGPVPGSTEQGSPGDLAFRIEGTTTAPPRVIAWYPKGKQASVEADISVTFDQVMNHRSAEKAFSIAPAVPGTTFSWSGNQMTFDRTAALVPAQLYTVKVSKHAKSSVGVPMAENFSWRFTTVSSTSGALALTATAAPTRAGLAQVTVNLSAASSVQATILNLAGRTIATLPVRELPAGVSTLLWDGRSASGTTAPPGRYLVQVTARTSDGASVRCLATLRR